VVHLVSPVVTAAALDCLESQFSQHSLKYRAWAVASSPWVLRVFRIHSDSGGTQPFADAAHDLMYLVASLPRSLGQIFEVTLNNHGNGLNLSAGAHDWPKHATE
jgi:hypothetical protein